MVRLVAQKASVHSTVRYNWRRNLQCSIVDGLAALLVFSTAPGVAAPAFAGTPSARSGGAPPPVTAGTTVVGRITLWEKDRCVIRTEENHEIEVQLDEATFVGKGIRLGEKVLAVVLANGHARSIEPTP
jgi:hypothetical protein